MTLLHQAAQKAVEALKKVDGALESRGEYVQEISAALVNLQAALREAALQQQEVPREPVADTHIDALLNALDDVAREYDSYEYGLPMHNSGEADDPLHKLRAAVREWLAASPSTTQQQEAGSGRVLPHPGSPEASAMLDSLLAEYQWPANSKNAARAGWEAANRWLAAAPSTPESAEKDDAGGVSMDDRIEAWHNGAGDGKPLHEFLGMTPEQYAEWVRNPDGVPASRSEPTPPRGNDGGEHA